MTIGLFSIFASLLGLFLIVKTIFKFRKGHLSSVEMLFWNMLWVVLIVVALTPGVTTTIAAFFGIGSGSNLVIYVSIIGLFFLNYVLYSKVVHQEHEITRLVRELSKKK
ncbi:MAG: DUF2304 domain-containing protein [Candidatus Woesearchaeota archaeon]